MQMANTLHTFHALKPVTTGWQAHVVAERIVLSTNAMNDQQPRGY
jgi:hypothetical protein